MFALYSQFELMLHLLNQKLMEEMWKPFMFISRALSDTEKQYAQVEKALIHSCTYCACIREELDNSSSSSSSSSSRAPVNVHSHKMIDSEAEVNAFVPSLPATETRMTEIQVKPKAAPICLSVTARLCGLKTCPHTRTGAILA